MKRKENNNINNPLEDANSFNLNVHHSGPNQEIHRNPISGPGITWTEI